MSLFRKRQPVKVDDLARQVASVSPWKREGLHAAAVLDQAGKYQPKVFVEITGSEHTGVPARFHTSDVRALLEGRSFVAETVTGAPELMFFMRAGVHLSGSAAGDVTADAPAGTLVLACAAGELRVAGMASAQFGAELQRWLGALP